MNKILIGGVGTALVGFLASWHFGLCTRCADARVAAPSATVAVAPATAEAVASCQTNVDAVTKGKSISYQSGGSTIAASSMAEVEAIAKAVKDCAGTTMEVAGHTDLTGNVAANQKLSQDRAEAVLKALTDKGVPAGQLVAKGYGVSHPVMAGMSAEANAKNRRTEFHLQAAAAAAPAN
jgi:OOP family OmpA-OmpF porin